MRSFIPSSGRARALAAAAFVALLLGGASPPSQVAQTAPATPQPMGQWVWTTADAELHREVRAGGQDIDAAVFVATFQASAKPAAWLDVRRAMSPTATHASTVVVRFDDSLHPVWAERTRADIAEGFGDELTRLLGGIADTGAEVTTIQLDYDAPVRRLPAWAEVVRQLADGPLDGLSVWITSIPSHVAHAPYGRLFEGAVDGHVLQLFDTGLPCTPANRRRVKAHLSAARLPYQLGFGAFERGDDDNHGCWLRQHDALVDAQHRGTWIFPAGHPYLPLLP